MWKVQLTGTSLSTLDVYIENYQGFFLDRFFDTGIWSEDVIRTNYDSEAIKLYDTIYDHVVRNMSRDLIGYESTEGDMRTTATFLEKRIVFIEYKEDRERYIRYIYSLKIVYR